MQNLLQKDDREALGRYQGPGERGLNKNQNPQTFEMSPLRMINAYMAKRQSSMDDA